jgi:DNA polymerase-3 subunit delta
MADKPVIYLLHGDDEFAINEEIKGLENRVGDDGTGGMNVSRIEGQGFTIESLMGATQAVPFLADRRLVILTDPLSSMKSPILRERFLSAMDRIPKSTALVLKINRPLVNNYDKRKGVKHWLQKWAAEQGDRVFEKEYTLPHGLEMVDFIHRKATELGGEFSREAAYILSEYVNENPRLATKEIEKLLVHVNFKRPVEYRDVELLTPYYGEANVFQMVDALGQKDGKVALQLLHNLLENDDSFRLFSMIVRQFRMLLLTKELLNQGLDEANIAKKLNVFNFISRKLISQAHNFTVKELSEIYHQLLDYDLSVKTGKLDGETGLDLLVTSLTR